MTNEEALRLRAGDRICVPSRLPTANSSADTEADTVKIVVHRPDYTSIWVLTTTERSFRPPQIANATKDTVVALSRQRRGVRMKASAIETAVAIAIAAHAD